jgi:serine/threonine protein kinase/Tol biopolymer transport system component
MPVKAGARLGPYEVLSPLGAGGMGEVYRARDARLAREVAIKVLPGDSTTDPERLQRFEQEAKAVGALNHPNLVAVFDTGQHEGAPFVVFELLEGETLGARMARKPLPPPKALDYAIQIARGLAAAHEKGIVHRDLKPENLFLTRDGRIKILDFGLAKLRPPLDPGDIGVQTPTASVLSEAGRVLGTVGYMSPEQVRQSPVDPRSDIFSFGSVLYELLSGKRAFVGGSEAETMAAIVNADPPQLAEANGKVPGALERIVRHCLEKRPDDRFQSARDLVFDLESVAAASNALSVEGASSPRPRLGLLRMLAAAMVGGAVVLVGGLWKWPRAPEPLAFKQVTFRRGNIAEARFAPDGQTIVYGAALDGRHNRLFSARMGSPEVRALDLPEGDIAAISASGEMAIVLSGSYNGRVPGTLARVSLAGGAPRELAEKVSMADWGPDGRGLAVVRHDGDKRRLEFPIGKVLYESDTGIRFPRVSPKGDRVAFLTLGEHGLVLCVVDLSGKTTTLATGDLFGVAWSPKGDEVWFTEWGVIRAVTLGGAQRILTRVPGPITINDVSPDGRVLVTMAQWYNGLVVAGPGGTERDLAWFDGAALAALSRNGDTVLFSDRGRGTGSAFSSHTYLRRTDGSPAVRLGEGTAYSLSPDGKWAISGLRGPSRCLLLPTGPGEARPLPVGNLACENASWFPDGKRLLIAGEEPGRPFRLFAQDLDGGERRAITPEGLVVNQIDSIGLNFFGGEVSPDGKLIVGKGPQGNLVLFPVEGGEARSVPATKPDEVLAGWGADSQSVYVYPLEGDLPVRIDTINLRSGRRRPFKEITPPDPNASGGIEKVVVTPGGKAYAYQYGQYPCILFVIEGLR